jgi:hypothetical protein
LLLPSCYTGQRESSRLTSDYMPRTHHTQADTLDKILPDDLEQASIVMAATAYSVTELEQMLPRKERECKLVGRRTAEGCCI